MKAIILENDILINHALNVEFSVNYNQGGKMREWRTSSQNIKFNITSNRNNFNYDEYVKIYEQHKLITKKNLLVIFENLSCIELFGTFPLSINFQDNSDIIEIDFNVDHYIDIEHYENDEIQKLWLKHNRNNRINQILS